MKTTLDLPDDLVQAVKVRAAHEDRRLEDVIADLIRRGLDQPIGTGPGDSRVQLPLVHTAHPARAEEVMTPERVAEILSREDTSPGSISDGCAEPGS